jgi:hypothetical protein
MMTSWTACCPRTGTGTDWRKTGAGKENRWRASLPADMVTTGDIEDLLFRLAKLIAGQPGH